MIETISVSSKGQIVIPEKMRNKLRIKEGSRLVLVEKADKIIIEKEETVENNLEDIEDQEKAGWLILAEESMKKLWDNSKDEKEWKKYLGVENK